jgi:hypothetical protein
MACSEFNFKVADCTNVDVGHHYTRDLSVSGSTGITDLTTLEFVMVVKDRLDGTILLTLNEVNDNLTTGFYIPAPTTGVIHMIITDTDSTAVGSGYFPYEMLQTDALGHSEIFMQGNLQFFTRDF